MILLQLKRYIRQHQRVTLENIKNRFDISEDTAQGLLLPLMKQGHIVEIPAASCSSGLCSSSCHAGSIEFQWLNKKVKPLPSSIQIAAI